jgi:hypothetical protein
MTAPPAGRQHQQADGGWGTHVESPSTMFGTTLCYAAARILGGAAHRPDSPRTVEPFGRRAVSFDRDVPIKVFQYSV